jgi:predicted RNase H-like HicB family nuclease
MQNVAKYRITLAWSDEDQAWIAEAPELLGCAADGTTPQEAVANILDAIERWLRIAHEEGWSIPTPQHYAQAS